VARDPIAPDRRPARERRALAFGATAVSAVVATSLILLAFTLAGGNGDGPERIDLSNFSGGLFDDPDYRQIYATCRPGRLLVEFDPDSRTEVTYGGGNPVLSLSATEVEVGCADAVVDDRRHGWYQRGLTGATGSVALKCRTDRPIDIFVSPLFGRGERTVVGGWMIISTPARNAAPRILVASTYDEEDDRALLNYRTARCRVRPD
jgi:hypothetical protein